MTGLISIHSGGGHGHPLSIQPIHEGQSPRFQYLFRRLLRTVQAVVDNVAEELLHSQFKPISFELGFGKDGDLPPVELTYIHRLPGQSPPLPGGGPVQPGHLVGINGKAFQRPAGLFVPPRCARVRNLCPLCAGASASG